MRPELIEAYDAYVAAGQRLFDLLQPTVDEIQLTNFEILDLGFEELLCSPTDPTNGGDIGLLAANVYILREIIEEETVNDEKGED